MTNTQIPSPVPLSGRGFVAKLKGNYQPGEYKLLSNVLITDDGILRNRRNIYTFKHGNYQTLASPHPIYGSITNYTIVGSDTQHQAVDEGSIINLWSPAGLPVPAGGWHRIQSAFLYNNRYYWITLAYDPTAATYTYHAYHRAVGAAGLADPDLTLANMEDATLKVIPAAEVPVTNGPFTIKAFIQKDRLWIVTRNRLYFSKATDPTVFAVPDGGFFGIRDQIIRDTAFLGDNIFILGQNETHVLTYSSDPNEDSYMRKIADVGGDSIVIHGDTPYFVSRLGVYQVFNSSVNKLNDLQVEYPYGLTESDIKLVSFENYLIVIARNVISYGAGNISYAFSTHPVGALNYNVFFINTANGATHTLDFTDCNDNVWSARGYIADAYVNTTRNYSDGTSNHKLVFMTNRWLGGNRKGNLYYMLPQHADSVYDEARKEAGTLTRLKPRISIEIDSYVPDGAKYVMKKFRYLQAAGKLPATDFYFTCAFDNKQYAAERKTIIGTDDFSNMRPHLPYRLPINQRARSINLMFKTDNIDTELAADGVWDHFELSDLRLVWSHTNRVNEHRALTEGLATP
jgi:hypothetical protein